MTLVEQFSNWPGPIRALVGAAFGALAAYIGAALVIPIIRLTGARGPIFGVRRFYLVIVPIGWALVGAMFGMSLSAEVH
jgi:hypothetical protein